MKYIILLPLLMLYSCDGAYKKEKESVVDVLIFGNDTITIIGAHIIDFSKLGNGYSLHGYWDSTRTISYTEVKLSHNPDTSTVLEGISIGTHKGDIISGKAVKNVYNK